MNRLLFSVFFFFLHSIPKDKFFHFFQISCSHAASMVRNNRFRRDARAPDEDEEMWFSQDDENDDDSSPQVLEILKNKLDSDLDRIHRLWENKKGE